MQRGGDTETHRGGDTETHRGGHRNAQVWLTDCDRLTERCSYRSGAHLKMTQLKKICAWLSVLNLQVMVHLWNMRLSFRIVMLSSISEILPQILVLMMKLLSTMELAFDNFGWKLFVFFFLIEVETIYDSILFGGLYMWIRGTLFSYFTDFAVGTLYTFYPIFFYCIHLSDDLKK